MPIKLVLPIAVLISFAIGLISGTGIFFGIFAYAVKLNIRRRLEAEKYNYKPIDRLSDTRKVKREPVNYLPVSIVAPIVDSAGVAISGDELRFNAQLTDISSLGATILSMQFLSQGLIIFIACHERKMAFPIREAAVMNIKLLPHGLRIGLRFTTPLVI